MAKSERAAIGLFAALLLATAFDVASAVDHAKFRTCQQTGFCRRHLKSDKPHPYVVAPNSLTLDGSGEVTGKLHGGPFGVSLSLRLIAYSCGAARLRITETNPLNGPRWEPTDILEAGLAAVPLTEVTAASLGASHPLHADVTSGAVSAYGFGAEGAVVAITYHPFKAVVYLGEVSVMTLNPQGKFYYEHHRKKDENLKALPSVDSDVHAGKTVVDYGEDGLAVYSDGTKQQRAEEMETAPASTEGDALWEETFGSHRDSKPFGPASVGMDVTFDGANHLYGLAEHAAPLNLPSTSGSGAKYNEPYRMYTLDVYDYELESPMALYGGVPLVYAHSTRGTVGFLWFNPTETFIDVSRTGGDGWVTSGPPPETSAYFMSESGIVDVMLLPGPTPAKAFSQYAGLTGTTPLPPRFSLGYHQCRWNYNDEDDVRYVHGQFEALDIPYDVLWLDIEHTDGKRYFTWDNFKFPKPKEMQQLLAQTGRKMVTIVDPHIKKDSNYKVYQEAHEKGLFIQKPDGSELDGWCWPGASAYLDFTSSMVRDWWAGRFAYDKYEGSTETLYTWNDMNEPSVFNGPEVSMDKDAKSLAGIEHREWHNLYGMYMQQATAMGLLQRNPKQDKRPFVLSRSFYAGSQRWGAIWTGDNACKWTHLEAAMPMLLSLGLCGITFSGADVGGFLGKGGGYGDPDAELFTRWFQAGSYQPFFRGHAHHDSARREPWTWDDATTQRLRTIAMRRYQLLSYWYTLFFISEASGVPTMRPLWVSYPQDQKTWDIDKQFMAGSDLMVAPIYLQGAVSRSVYFPGATEPKEQTPWYDVIDGTKYLSGSEQSVNAPIEKIPAYQRGGSIVPRQMRARRSSTQMANDPFTLTIAPSTPGSAAGRLYLDAGDGYEYRSGAYAYRKYTYDSGTLTSTALHSDASYTPSNPLERVEVLMSAEEAAKVTGVSIATTGGERTLDYRYDEGGKRLVIRAPKVLVAEDWSISLKSS